MPFQLAEAVPWGRSFDEYAAMFALSSSDLESRILGCGDGPASFNAELSARGRRVSMRELVRLAPEVRVFPLIELSGSRSRHLDAVIDALRIDGCTMATRDAGYEFQRGATQMLTLHR